MKLAFFGFTVAVSVQLAGAQVARFKTGVDAVRVDVLVTDGGRPVKGLTAADFDVRDNGVAQRITDVAHETLPLNIICVLDTSSSVAGAPLAQLKEATAAVIETMGKEDRAALVTFSTRLRIHSDLTDDRARLRTQLEQVKAEGATSFLDAAFAGLALRESDNGRTLLLLFSDGRDTASWLTARQLLEAARRSDVVVYPVTVKTDMARMALGRGVPSSGAAVRVRAQDPGERLLDAFADATGGRLIYADNESALKTTFVDVLSEFRQRYVLSYTPAGVAPDGWHAIEVRLRGRRGQIKARRGYVAAPVTPDAASKKQSK
jgi:VWFA-related protein